MPITDRDLEAWAARIRPYFEPHLQDIAAAAAAMFVLAVGARIKELRPETPMSEIFSWIKDARTAMSTSLDWVEILIATEEEVLSDTTDDFAEGIEQRTFREYVEHLHANQRRS